jgi:hypothetical protein
MSKRNDFLFAIAITVLVLFFVTSPFIIAAQSGGEEYVFNGFLLNPLDGNSYLAKMYQGWEGTWRFRLPFTPEPGAGAYLFLFYLGLGHVARLVNLPLLTVFHLARILGCLILLWTLWLFYGMVFQESRPRKLAFALSALGSGMGWLLITTGSLTSDFWVAETYPFLSSYANPHFPLGLSLVIWLVKPSLGRSLDLRTGLLIGAGALVLSVINPFGIVITIMILGGKYSLLLLKKRQSRHLMKRALIVGFMGLPLLAYDLWVAYTDPVLSSWNTQNLTPSPPVWDLIISLSPALLLGVWGVIELNRKAGNELKTPTSILLIWVGLGLILLYMPIGLQRRFMMGLYVPLAGLAALGLENLTRPNNRRYGLLTTGLFILAIPTNLVILLAAQSGIQANDPQIYLTRGEMTSLSWIKEKTEADVLVLSSPEMGLFIPAYTGRRVVYGHPFETVNAEAEEIAVLSFFDGGFTLEELADFLDVRDVDFILIGPRERSLGDIQVPQGWEAVYTSDDTKLYRVGK